MVTSAVVYGSLFVFVGDGVALGFCFIPAIGIAIGFPWGASKLIGALTDNPNRAAATTFFVEGIPFTLLGKRSAARETHICSIDRTSTSGRFAFSRNEMAEVIEQTAIRVWFSICCFMTAGVLYVVFAAIEVGRETHHD